METVFHIASFSGEVPTGWVADRWGRKTSLILGRLLTIVAAILLLKARSPVGFGIGFVFSALEYNCHSGAYDAMVYDELKADGKIADFTRVMGFINVLYLGRDLRELAATLRKRTLAARCCYGQWSAPWSRRSCSAWDWPSRLRASWGGRWW